MPYLDLPVTSPYFASVQRIGATGLLHGEGRNVGWSNETWFRISDPLLRSELGDEFREFFPETDFTAAGDVVTVGETIDFIEKLKDNPACNSGRIEACWNHSMLGDFNRERPITRLEFAVIMDHIVNPFGREIDYKGFLKR